MRIFQLFLVMCMVVGLSACATKFRTYNGPEVTRVVVMKTDRQMYLMHHDKVLKSFDFDLGFAPEGHKEIEGDGRTPEGRYFIDRRNPNSLFYLRSRGIDEATARGMLTYAFAEDALRGISNEPLRAYIKHRVSSTLDDAA